MKNYEKINFILSIFILIQLEFSLPVKAQSRCQETIVINTNNRGDKIWQVFYQPSRTTMWLHDCDLSIPQLVD
ncbi:MAG: hypothetical protein EWV42_01020 [Microcystis panniformis Mp_GB_SS_20050300_S99D]|nr:MAG: hypothetical protein EWV43_23980 [Microcystis panniformis Mp_MB_F_20080800_S26D]TRV45185.1 MAG: hypothetical protein EWV87_17905 [Microcystis panniformis Mp_GB_SS_20050300_S99]TRV55709.1 MAG: hypothetical protein EWV42_01020 [Microcystis panniformis Mp_GB_SS_20050300_S99D]TRV57319.1 MAG: hypothetical protein EWV69_16360 [Microcystis panniformis Mp_MB_F_20080800_S26]